MSVSRPARGSGSAALERGRDDPDAAGAEVAEDVLAVERGPDATRDVATDDRRRCCSPHSCGNSRIGRVGSWLVHRSPWACPGSCSSGCPRATAQPKFLPCPWARLISSHAPWPTSPHHSGAVAPVVRAAPRIAQAVAQIASQPALPTIRVAARDAVVRLAHCRQGRAGLMRRILPEQAVQVSGPRAGAAAAIANGDEQQVRR